MPKVTIEFNLPEERAEYELNQDALPMWCVISQLREFLRSKLKYSELTTEEAQVYRHVQQYLFDLLQEHEVKEHQ